MVNHESHPNRLHPPVLYPAFAMAAVEQLGEAEKLKAEGNRQHQEGRPRAERMVVVTKMINI